MSNTPEKASKPTKYRDMNPEELAIAIEENKKIFGEHFDLTFMKSLCDEVIEMLKIYFRPVFVDFEEMPERNNPDHPVILACNHSGMAFPWDAIVFATGVSCKSMIIRWIKLFRPLAAPMLSASKLMNPFLLTDIWKRVGAVDANGLEF